VLARANRVTSAGDFRAAMRRGRRVGSAHVVLHVLETGEHSSRFGFIVTKAVGSAVKRNVVRRRLRAVCRDILPSVTTGHDVVIRALPGSESAPWGVLRGEVSVGLGISEDAS
jgi:ribonuclease P protein component